ncbi:hypothetical protein Tco_0341680, partial [Tanacetum coccineum]
AAALKTFQLREQTSEGAMSVLMDLKILKKFNYSDVKSASTPIDLEKPLVKDRDADDVDVHHRYMIGSLMYLTASRPDIMFAVCACARFQFTPKTSHLLAVKRIFRYLKGKLTLGLWYSRDSPFELVAYTDSDYAGATQDRKSTTRGEEWKRDCQYDSSLEAEAGDVNAQTRFEIPSKQSNDPPLSKGYTLGSGEDSMKLIGIDGILYTTLLGEFFHLDDAEGTDCLPTATIFEELARMGYEKPFEKLPFYKSFFSPQWKYFIHTTAQCLSAKSTAWNEFSSSMAS